MTTPFSTFLADHQPQIESALAEFFTYQQQVLEASVQLPQQSLLAKVENLTMRGGKRLRSALTILGYQLWTENSTESPVNVVKLAASQELLQSFLLIHDDVIDRSDQRRGQPTVHKLFQHELNDPHLGQGAAILAGDLAWSLAQTLVLDTEWPADQKLAIFQLLNQTISTTIHGQELDVLLSVQTEPAVELLWRLAESKTGYYSIGLPLKLGSVAAGIPASQVSLFDNLAAAMGRVFQLSDDLLPLVSSDQAAGKSMLSDFQEGKVTWLTLRAHDPDVPTNREMSKLLGLKSSLTEAQALELRQLMIEAGLAMEGTQLLAQFAAEAHHQLDRLAEIIQTDPNWPPVQDQALDQLSDLKSYLANRTK